MGVAHREADVLTACLQYLTCRGVFCWRSNNAGVYDPVRKRYRAFRGLKGVSDILGIIPQQVQVGGEVLTQGIFLAVEVKRQGGRASTDQDWFLEKVRELGGIGLCVRSAKELEERLEPYLQFAPGMV